MGHSSLFFVYLQSFKCQIKCEVINLVPGTRNVNLWITTAKQFLVVRAGADTLQFGSSSLKNKPLSAEMRVRVS